ncbi:MAG: AMP-binding protein, partial [Sphingorhabdus sp.]|nr:AMP-binding protein [Sphingorhabdus sp.]
MTEKLRAIMAIDPARTEIEFNGIDYSWRQIADVVQAIEAALLSMDLPVDARIGVMLRNRPGHIAAIVAVLSSDRCLVTLNPILPDVKLFADVADLDLPVIIADASDLARPGMGEAMEHAGSAVIEIGPCLEGVRIKNQEIRNEIHTSPGIAIEMLT